MYTKHFECAGFSDFFFVTVTDGWQKKPENTNTEKFPQNHVLVAT